MKALKALVIFMGILLVAGLGVLGWGLATRAGRTTPAPHPVATQAGAPFGDVEVALPAGAKVAQMETVGERVVVRVTAAGGERLVVFDPAAGRVMGTFVLVPAK
jgi:hypothetical protein